MSGFTKYKVGDVEVEHYSCASLIKMIVTRHEPVSQGGELEVLADEVWFDYSSISDLIAIAELLKEEFEPSKHNYHE